MQSLLGIGPLAWVGVEHIACSVDCSETQSKFLKLACKPLLLAALSYGVDIKVRTRPGAPCADTQLHIADTAFRAPGKELPTAKLGQRI
jgi:hypothetical protein